MNAIFFILVQSFCLLKIKITRFPSGFRLNYFVDYILCKLSVSL